MRDAARLGSALLAFGWVALAASWARAQSAPSASADPAGPPPAAAPPATAAPVPVAPSLPAATASLTGQVYLAALPAAAISIVVEDAAGALHRAETAADGRFRLDGLAPGPCTITSLGESGEQDVRPLELSAGATASVTIRLTAASKSGETIVVRGLTKADERRESADAVTVVETERAKRETADLGEVLARTQGVSLRKEGGLGSRTRLSLAGLSDEQVRVFLDGIPLELAGYPFGIANVPVNLVERIEIYNGVLPIRFGADALGGGVNLVSDEGSHGTRAAASYETGSFGTHRLTLSGSTVHAPTGLYARAVGFFDRARNDFPIQAEVDNPTTGKISIQTVDRFHDGYLAGGGSLELGLLERRWAKRLALRVYGSGYAKDLQSDLSMNRVYGEVTYGQRSLGTSLRYHQAFPAGVSLDATAGYTFTRGEFRDVSACDYNWYGDCFRQGNPGESDAAPHLQISWEHAVYARVNAEWKVAPKQALRLSLAPTYVTRSGDERLDPSVDGGGPGRDPLTAERELTSFIAGAEHQLDAIGDRLQNLVFAKVYVQGLASEDPQPGGLEFLRVDRRSDELGIGDGLRYRFAEWFYGKLSYEWSTRLPRAVEVFGDNVQVVPNLGLAPETSHNVNASVIVEDLAIACAGELDATVTGFLRETSELIAQLTSANELSYQNVFGARSVGVEASAAWTSPGEVVLLEGSGTYQSFRNSSSGGLFGSFEGDRIPNTPYLFGYAGARVQWKGLFGPRDTLALLLHSRYVRGYFRSWESVGDRDTKDKIPSQLVHSAGLSYSRRAERYGFSATAEVANLTDEAAYDNFRQQRPGRALYLKLAFEL